MGDKDYTFYKRHFMAVIGGIIEQMSSRIKCQIKE